MPDAERMLVFSDDWGRHPSSCQHIVKRLLGEFDVSWVNTIGMRAPQLGLSTLTRGVEKLGHWLRRPVGSNSDNGQLSPKMYSPIMWPWFRNSFDRGLNRRLVVRHLRNCRGTPYGVSTIPIVADIMPNLDVGSWTYYCVDDWSTWVGLDHKPLAKMEIDVLEQSDQIISASKTLQDRLRGLGYDSQLLTHGVDISHWSGPPISDAVDFLRDVERPIVVQWGMINRNLDVDALANLGNRMTRGTIVLVGPSLDVDPDVDRIDRLQRFPKIPYTHLPTLAREASVLLMAYQANEGTVASQPLKLKEYMATGKAVVARRIPATEEWTDAVDLYETPEEFGDHVLERLSSGTTVQQCRGRERLADETWEKKAELFSTIVTGSKI